MAVGVGVLVAVGVGEKVAVAVGAGIAVAVAVGVAVGVGVNVGFGAAVGVGLGVGVAVAMAVCVGASVGVATGIAAATSVGVCCAVGVGVGVGLFAGVVAFNKGIATGADITVGGNGVLAVGAGTLQNRPTRVPAAMLVRAIKPPAKTICFLCLAHNPLDTPTPVTFTGAVMSRCQLVVLPCNRS